MNTKQKGDIAESKFISLLIEKGYNVSVPFGDNTKYDVVVENENKELEKVQVKHGNHCGDIIKFNLESETSTNGKRNRVSYTKDEVDWFGVYVPETDRYYRIPFEDTPKTEMWLRLKPPKNNQIERVNLARDYELHP